MPTSYAPSSLDTLNEEMQLSSQIVDLQLLLDGALNDRFITGSQVPKRRVTVGINITINPCLDNGSNEKEYKKGLKDRAAEVEIEVENPPGNNSSERPSIMTLLPREKTYNVASLSSKSITAGAGGVLGGVFSVGGGWFWNKQKYFLVKQQDTLAIEESPSKFLWQFRPVLGQDYLLAGTRQNFVQFALPEDSDPNACQATLKVTTRWRKVDPATGLVGAPELAAETRTLSVPYIDATDTSQLVGVRDIGGGLVDVQIKGKFQEGVAIRIGGAVIAAGAPGFNFSYDQVEFTASAKDILAADGVYLVDRDGGEVPVMTRAAIPLPSCQSGPSNAVPNAAPAPAASNAAISNLSIEPFSDALSLVTLTFTENQIAPHKSDPRNNPILASLGSHVFGLQDAPFRSLEKMKSAADSYGFATWKIAMLAPTEVLASSSEIVVQRLFNNGDSASVEIPMGKYPKQDFAVTSIKAVSAPSKKEPTFQLLVTGTGLDQATLSAPSCAHFDSTPARQSSYAFVTLSEDCQSSAKVLILTYKDLLPAVVPIPSLDAASAAAAKAAIDPMKSSVAPGTKELALEGPGLDQIKTVKFGKTPLSFVLALDKKSAVVALPAELTASQGIRYLDIGTADGKTARYELTVKKP
jgi:hypothetical protein